MNCALSFYLFNYWKFAETTIIVQVIIFEVAICIIGLILITYYADIFFQTFFMILNLGLLTGNYNDGLSYSELITYWSLSAFSIVCLIYSIIKKKNKIWGDDSYSENFQDLINQERICKLSITSEGVL